MSLEQEYNDMVADLWTKGYKKASGKADVAKKILMDCGPTIGPVVDSLADLAVKEIQDQQLKEGLKQLCKVQIEQDLLAMLAEAEN